MLVRIYKKLSGLTQSSGQGRAVWLIEPEINPTQTIEPLMGWVSAEHPYSALQGRLRFDSLEKAQAFAHKCGWRMSVERAHEKRFVPRNYLENFNPDRRRDGR